MPSEKRALISVFIFTAFGLFGVLLYFNDLANAWPLMFFYVLLVCNDYFSIRHFAKIISPKRTSQIIVDSILTLLHFAAVLFFGIPWDFALIMTILFIVAILKYSWDLPAIANSRALYRKIKIDSLGAFISAGALAGISFGFSWPSVIIWTIIFLGASIYVILINPLYKDTLGPS
jgi:hypothetical protein